MYHLQTADFEPRISRLTSYGEEPINQILDDALWQSGSIENETILMDHRIDMVINLCRDEPVSFRFPYPFREVRYPIGDGRLRDVNLGHIHHIAVEAAGHIRAGGRVLSHCQMGWNRSGLMSGLILLELGFEHDVVEHIRHERSPQALCNVEFADYLRATQLRMAGRPTAGTGPG